VVRLPVITVTITVAVPDWGRDRVRPTRADHSEHDEIGDQSPDEHGYRSSPCHEERRDPATDSQYDAADPHRSALPEVAGPFGVSEENPLQDERTEDAEECHAGIEEGIESGDRDQRREEESQGESSQGSIAQSRVASLRIGRTVHGGRSTGAAENPPAPLADGLPVSRTVFRYLFARLALCPGPTPLPVPPSACTTDAVRSDCRYRSRDATEPKGNV
jgi:hypothetical protein